MVDEIYIEIRTNGKKFDNAYGYDDEIIAHIDGVVNEHANDNSEPWCKFRDLFKPDENGSRARSFLDACMKIANETEDFCWEEVERQSEPDDRETGFVGYTMAFMETYIDLDVEFDLDGFNKIFGEVVACGTEDIEEEDEKW